jgi:hypothetical protein
VQEAGRDADENLVLALPAHHAPTPPVHALVFASEFHLSSSRSSALAGRFVIQLANQGQDAHDLSVRRDGGGTVLATTGEVAHASLGELRGTLRPGRYVFFCAAPGHEALGMRSVLTVRAKR